jgi:aminoglycoside phosphotransferase
MADPFGTLVAGYRRERVELGQAAETFKLTAPGRPTRYLKMAPGLERERARLAWLVGRLPAPRVIAFVGDALLLDELPGTPIQQATFLSIEARVAALAAAMRRVHALPVAECPFDARFAARLAEARERVRAGQVDESDFEPERRGWTAAAVLAELERRRPPAEDLVVVHGDCTLDNVLVAGDGAVAGFVDVGRLGVGDRWQDLAIAARDVAGEYGEAWVEEMLTAYGATPEPEKRELYVLMDELS